MKIKINEFWKKFKKDPDSYLTIIIAILTAGASLLGVVDVKIVLSLVLATIALISLSLLKNREENRSTQESLSQLNTTGALADKFLKQEFNVHKTIQLINRAHKVNMFGMGFTIFTPILHDYLSHNIESIPEIKILFMKPRGSAVKIAALRAGKSEEDLSNSYEKNLAFLDELVIKSNGKIEYRLLDYLPPYNIVAIDPHLPQGLMLIRLAAWRASTAERPLFELEKETDAKWFEYFDNQFAEMWDAALKTSEVAPGSGDKTSEV